MFDLLLLIPRPTPRTPPPRGARPVLVPIRMLISLSDTAASPDATTPTHAVAGV
jgi:hypothetical protein